jgi:hypothetical protein
VNRAPDALVRDLSQRSGEYANAVGQQGAVGRMVDVGLHDRGVGPHPASTRHLLCSRPLDNILVQAMNVRVPQSSKVA